MNPNHAVHNVSNELPLLSLGVAVLTCVFVFGCHGTNDISEGGDRNNSAITTGTGPIFTNITMESGLGDFKHETGAFGQLWLPESLGAGGAFIDYNNNGLQDILLVAGGWFEGHEGSEDIQALEIYRNNGDATFTNVTDEAGLANIRAYGFGIAVADYDNDGWQDFFFSVLGRDMLFKNNQGFFAEVGRESGIADVANWSTSAIFFDSDNNGLIDLYVGAYVEWSPDTDVWCSLDGTEKSYCTPETYEGIPGRFYKNNGDGTFENVTIESGFQNNPGATLGIAEYDITGNGFPDLFVANDLQRDLFYRNNGDGTFTERGALSGLAYDDHGRARAGMGIDVGVVENGGKPTMFVTNFSNEMIGVYRHVGESLFIDRAIASGIGHTSFLTLGFGVFLFDADSDGFLDVLVANGHVHHDITSINDAMSYAQAPHLFLNRGDGTFEDAAPELGGVWETKLVGRGAAYADITGNGRLDVLVTENDGPVSLWRNTTENGNNFLRIHLEGTQSNRDGIGSTVVVRAGDLEMERRVRTGSSYLSNSEKTLTFGLGRAALVESLVVNWPSGLVEEFSDVEPNLQFRLVEGTGELIPIPPTMILTGPHDV